ncbi:GNAT family N-acetyltransferase [Vibrio sp. JC009]|uniref:GNAT family N-acetyltransferase n=1 Tax=Vibrio sp. JC009 TaxID=2912314 RepID=UPI0023B001DC|nr:GNAT family N-acetyltransferase [Vibrio sp. JC009]WED22118.1 GNAT family N-acetyltransferase [Vibrio sp. JC009]
MISWQLLSFDQLTTHQLYELLKLRVDVFVVEQTCPYPELDNKDLAEGVYQLIGYKDNEIVACARLLPAGISFDNVSIGRFASKQTARGNGLGHKLMSAALEQCEVLWPGQSIDIQAQEYLRSFYEKHGFRAYTESYLEDDIPHLDMRLEK